jgi:glycosyltransferase involved in cell wall biosynthesis
VHVGFSLLTLLPGKVGGSETYVQGLLGAFGDGEGPERTTVLVTDRVRRTYEPAVRGAVGLREVPYWRYPQGTAPRALSICIGLALGKRLAREASANIDLLHYPLTVSIPRSPAASVVTYHDAQHLEHPAFFSRPERWYRALTYDRAARRASLVVTPSEFTREIAIDRLGLSPERVRACTSGIDHARFRPDGERDDQILANLELPERYLVYPANLWPHKNHGRLLQALGMVRDEELALVLTGGASARMHVLQTTAERAGISSRVRHLGYVEDDVLPALYRRAQGMIFPSLYEGFGSPPLEAMACGCPTAVARAGALPESCGTATLYFDPASPESIAEAIDRMAADSALRDGLREMGIRHAEGFTWAASAHRHTAAYRDAIVMGEPPGAR